nr:efflux RND transporter periplasmic adaptor subunit [Pseudenhygromyxa sp. WMMC2535]
MLEPWRRAELSPRYGGQIAERLVEEQDEVAEGDLLVRLVDADAKGSLISAQASRRSGEEQLSDLERQLEDTRALFESGAINRREIERLETEIATTKASIRQAAGQVIQSRDRKQANAILAPFSGVITALEAEVGEYASPGAALLTLSQLDALAIDVPLSEDELVLHERGKLRFEVRVRGQVVDAQLAWVAREADPGTNTFTARLRLDNADEGLRAGETVVVKVHGEKGDRVKVVPPTAVRWEGQQAYLLRATTVAAGESGEAREQLERVDVRVHEDVAGAVAIEGPIEPGDHVVSAGLQTLVDGDLVAPVGEVAAAASAGTSGTSSAAPTSDAPGEAIPAAAADAPAADAPAKPSDAAEAEPAKPEAD